MRAMVRRTILKHICILVALLTIMPSARADSAGTNDDFGLHMRSIDTLESQIVEKLRQYFKDLRQRYDSGHLAHSIWIAPAPPYQCIHDIFSYTTQHQIQADGTAQDLILFARCGRQIMSITLVRAGAGVTSVSDDDLLNFKFPEPSSSEKYNLTFSWVNMTILSQKISNGTQGVASLKFSGGEFTVIVNDVQSDRQDTVHDRSLNVKFFDGSQNYAWFMHARRETPGIGMAASYYYDFTDNGKTSNPANLERFKLFYRGTVEMGVAGTFMGNVLIFPKPVPARPLD
jgi:hypothetical protein